MEKVNGYYEKAMKARADKNTAESVKYLQKAIKRIGQFIKKEPKNPVYPFRRAQIYSSIKAHKYAISDLLLTIRNDQNNTVPLFLLGNAYLESKEFSMAIEAYGKFFVLEEQYPSGQNHAEVYFNRAIARNGLEWYDEALMDLDTVAELNPNYPKLSYCREVIEKNKLSNS
jgi:tetratricopeptide (TPR) repeat protein